MIRRLLLPLVLAALALASGATAAEPVFVVEGRGWGHGIGMPQYGAYGYAREEGRSHAWILDHYYPGTALAQTNVGSVRVLLADDRSALSVGSAAAFTVTDANDRTYSVTARTLRLPPSLRVSIGGVTRTLASPVRVTRGARVLTLDGRPYRGQLVVRSSGGTLSAVNHVGLEEYLYGVVPDEMPPSWHMEALKAQAVAARSYAVVSRRTSGVFDLFSDTRSQVYGGVASEEPRANQAIDETAGQVLTHGGRVAWTFFHSTSGGRTAAIHDVWNASPVPYLVSVADPYDRISPYHRWGPLRYTARQLRAEIGSASPSGSLLDAVVARNASQRAETVTLRGSRGTTRLSGDGFQARLGLRSSWFSIAVLSIGGPAKAEFGASVPLRGLARGPESAFLERRGPNGRWTRVRPLERNGAGEFRAVVQATASASYRVFTPRGTSLPHRVAVTALVRFAELDGRKSLAGVVRPARAGVRVAVQRLTAGRWRTVAEARTAANGRFSAAFAVTPGSYRAVATVPGLLPGTSPAVRVAAP